MFFFCDTNNATAKKSQKFQLFEKVLACCFAAGAVTISKNHITCASKKITCVAAA